jgi:hypothetical protein
MTIVEILCDNFENTYFVKSFLNLNHPQVEILENEGGFIRLQCNEIEAYEISSFIALRKYTENIRLIDTEENETVIEIVDTGRIQRFMSDQMLERTTPDDERQEPTIIDNHIRAWTSL